MTHKADDLWPGQQREHTVNACTWQGKAGFIDSKTYIFKAFCNVAFLKLLLLELQYIKMRQIEDMDSLVKDIKQKLGKV